MFICNYILVNDYHEKINDVFTKCNSYLIPDRNFDKCSLNPIYNSTDIVSFLFKEIVFDGLYHFTFYF